MESLIVFLNSPTVLTVGFISSLIGIFSFVIPWFKRKKRKIYKGALDADFVKFISKNSDSILELSIQLDEEQSADLSSYVQGEKSGEVLFFSIPHDDVGTEVGFFINDPEVHWNTRFWSHIHTEGYFKVHSIQGPYQGWMSMTLRGVGKEHVSGKY